MGESGSGEHSLSAARANGAGGAFEPRQGGKRKGRAALPFWRRAPISGTGILQEAGTGKARGDAVGQVEARHSRGSVRDNPERNRFELDADGDTALAYYRIDNGVMVFTSTETPPKLRGQGVASELIRNALEFARARGLKVRGDCSFVADYLRRHPELADLAR